MHIYFSILGMYICGIDCSGSELGTRTLQYPVVDPKFQLFCLLLQGIGDIALLLQLIHDPQSLYYLLDTHSALKVHNTSRPHSGSYRVRMFTVNGIPFSERYAGDKLAQ